MRKSNIYYKFASEKHFNIFSFDSITISTEEFKKYLEKKKKIGKTFR